ncbi:MAG TPA: phytoene synthase, partial [Microbacterium sp.]|nr:phytoene synthase [Microbacterium sp.]
AVTAAHDLFAELSRRLRADPAPTARVRVPNIVKAGLIARALVGVAPRRTSP